MLQLGDVSYKNTGKHLGAWYPYKLLATSTSGSFTVQWRGKSIICSGVSAQSRLHRSEDQRFSPFVLHKYQGHCIAFVISWSMLCKDSAEAQKPSFACVVLHWETALRNYLYSFSSKTDCKDDLITSCIVIWKRKVLTCSERAFTPFWRKTVPWVMGSFVEGHSLWLEVCYSDLTFPNLM